MIRKVFMKKLLMLSLLFLFMNGLHATELLPESQGLGCYF